MGLKRVGKSLQALLLRIICESLNGIPFKQDVSYIVLLEHGKQLVYSRLIIRHTVTHTRKNIKAFVPQHLHRNRVRGKRFDYGIGRRRINTDGCSTWFPAPRSHIDIKHFECFFN
ncbi:hypothetical protein D3C80_1406610 [compost metagenome]